MPVIPSILPYQNLDIDERLKRVLATTPLIDGHNDLPQLPRACFHGKINNNSKFDLNKGFQRGMTDIPRLKEGKSSLDKLTGILETSR
jgi:membrane dipeptidase